MEFAIAIYHNLNKQINTEKKNNQQQQKWKW